MNIDKTTAAELCENTLARHISYRLTIKNLSLPVGDAHHAALSIMKTWSHERMLHFWRASREPNTFRPHRWWANELKVRREEIERWSQNLRAITIRALDRNGETVDVILFRRGREVFFRNNSKEFEGGQTIILARTAAVTYESAESVRVTTEKQTAANVDNYLGAVDVVNGSNLATHDEDVASRGARATNVIRGPRGEQLRLIPKTGSDK